MTSYCFMLRQTTWNWWERAGANQFADELGCEGVSNDVILFSVQTDHVLLVGTGAKRQTSWGLRGSLMTSFCSVQTDHVLLVGAGANQFEDELGYERVSNDVILFGF